MTKLEIYDPAMCCSSGVCGPAPDNALVSFAGTVEKIRATGISITRYNLAQEPLAFAQKPEVKAVLEKQGEDGLPLVFVDGEIYFRGVYPSIEQLNKVLGLSLEPESKCCDSTENCCNESAEKEPVAFVKIEAPKAVSTGCCDSSSGCC